MKLLIASDIHGSAFYMQKLCKRIEAEEADRVVLLGDLLYHGPRNDLPEGYQPKEVITLLNGLKEQLLCVRGNCDTEVDQMVLDFPILSDFSYICDGDVRILATHGHRFGPDNPPPLSEGDILLFGHTHIPEFTKRDGCYFVNPGSVSIPKENSQHGYILYEDGCFVWKSVEGEILRTESVKRN